MRITGGLYCERADFTENGCFCRERADFCRERAIRFPGVPTGAQEQTFKYPMFAKTRSRRKVAVKGQHVCQAKQPHCQTGNNNFDSSNFSYSYYFGDYQYYMKIKSCDTAIFYSKILLFPRGLRNWRLFQWASCQIRNIAGWACTRNAGNVFPQAATDFKGNRSLALPACITPRRRVKCSRHSRRMHNPQFHVNGKRPLIGYVRDFFPLCVSTSLSFYRMKSISYYPRQVP